MTTALSNYPPGSNIPTAPFHHDSTPYEQVRALVIAKVQSLDTLEDMLWAADALHVAEASQYDPDREDDREYSREAEQL